MTARPADTTGAPGGHEREAPLHARLATMIVRMTSRLTTSTSPAALARWRCGVGRRAPGGPQAVTAAPVAAAYLLLGLAWVFTNPPGFAPDEPEHYVKAIGVGHGELLGETAPYTYLPVVDEQMLDWQNRNTRSVLLPAGLGACLYYRLPIGGRCPEGPPPPTPARETTYVATYPPFMYVPAALVMRLATTTGAALHLGRLVTVLLSTAFVGAAAAALAWRREVAVALVGLVGAVTPTTVFVFSELSASGLEIAAGVCLAACLLRLANREPAPWLWAAVVASGVVLASSRTFGPAFVLFDLAWGTALVGRSGFRRVLATSPRWAAAAGAAIAAAAATTVAWQIAVAPRPTLDGAAVRHGLGALAGGTASLAREVVGDFGWVDVPLPGVVAAAWLAGIAGLVTAALAVGSARERAVLGLVGLGIAAVAAAVAVAIAASAPGFQMQARYVLPVVVALPLLAGDILDRRRDRLPWPVLRAALPTALVLAAVVQVVSLAVNARFYTDDVGGLVDFIPAPGWRPPLGWLAWATVTAVGAGLLLGAAITSRAAVTARVVSASAS